jgi:uncharacterized protein (TIGR00266 family)
MRYEVLHRPSYALAVVHLDPNESIAAESGAMVSMQDVEIQTEARGGIFSALKRKVLGGESFFQNTFRAGARGGEVTLAPSLPGDIAGHELRGETILVTSGCYLASHPSVAIDTKFGGARTFFSREGLFLLKCEGQGLLLLASYGAIHEKTLGVGEQIAVDTGHMVAFEASVQYEVRRVGGLKSTFFSGEGLVCGLTGPGKIWIQTRSEDAFLSWLIPQLPKRGN